MMRDILQSASEMELRTAFRELALRQYQANREDDAKTFNRVYDEIEAISDELRARPGDQRRALIPLLADGNQWVRYEAAVHTLVVAPEQARQTLDSVKAQRIDPIAKFYATRTLRALAEGSFPLR